MKIHLNDGLLQRRILLWMSKLIYFYTKINHHLTNLVCQECIFCKLFVEPLMINSGSYKIE